MQKFQIMTDSTADLPNNLVQSMDILVVPTDFTIKEKTYLDYPDDREFSKKDFYRLAREGEIPKTAVINPERFIQNFEPVLKEGTDILYFVFSSGLTTTMQNATIAATELKETYPDRIIRIVDTRAASLGEGMLVWSAAKKKAEGLAMEDIALWAESVRDKVCHWFTVDDLNFLKRGGRISGTSAAIGGVLNIKPIMHVSEEGKLVPTEKARGRKAALEVLLSKIAATAEDIGEQTVFLSHADSEEDCLYMKNEIIKRFSPKDVIIGMIGPVVGSHAGPGTIALFFFGSPK